VICKVASSYSKNRERNAAGGNSGPPRLVVRARPGRPTQGLLQCGHHVFCCALGRAGITTRKREGDGATPRGRLTLLWGYRRADRGRVDPSRLPLRPTPPRLGWCDAPGDRNYNRPVRLPYPASHETMRRADHLYDVVIVLNWNMRPAVRGRGSAIFLHLARPGYTPTEGCVAVSRRTMSRLLPILRQGAVIEVVR
jgi:L,D-peptidoglycan transpeptidase YkuD (ErfK/YbiS/YcfS/YnhG family)